MEIRNFPLVDLKPYEKNPRKNDKAVAAVANSIKQFGFKVPIVVDADNVIVCGHTRYKAAQQLGLDGVPCVVADDLSPAQVKAFRLADNKVAELATWDFELLDTELTELYCDGADLDVFFDRKNCSSTEEFESFFVKDRAQAARDKNIATSSAPAPLTHSEKNTLQQGEKLQNEEDDDGGIICPYCGKRIII